MYKTVVEAYKNNVIDEHYSNSLHNIHFKHDGVNLKVPKNMKKIFAKRVNAEQKFRIITRLMIENNIIDRNKNMIDLGAWIGDNSLIWSQMIDGQVYAIDPSEHNIDIIETLKTLNTIDNIITIQKPISNKKEFVTIKEGDINHASFEVSNNGIQTETLDNLYANDIINNIGFMHLDVEGFEYKVVEGSQNIISIFKPIIVTESHKGDKDVEPLISKHGYNKYVIDEICGGNKTCRNT